jgi:ABC-type histidine transport system ATPase subunit
MRNAKRLAVLVVCGTALSVGLSQMRCAPTLESTPDTVYVTRSAKAETIAVATLRTVRDTRTVFDSVFQTDTLWRRDTVIRVVVESLLVQCERCGRELAAFRAFADTVQKANRDTITQLRRDLAACKTQRPWWASAGLAVGVLACRG